ncbi:MAG: B12-binding domain-containing radical SAM protein [Betaproteobacteria bacterium]
MRVALVNSPVHRPSPHARLSPPLGLAYLAATLAQDGHDVAAVDFNVSGLNLRRVDRLVEVDKPVIVGISAYTETYPNALAIARRVKELSPDTVTILGGPHPTLLPAEALAEDCVDGVVIGEGEVTMSELARRVAEGSRDFRGIKGLAFKDSGTVRLNEPRELLDPDTLPYPARDLLPLELYANPWTVLTSRGACPFRCPFCAAFSLWNGKRRARQAAKVVAEVQMLMEKYGATYIFFSDDLFTLDRRWVRELLSRLQALPELPAWGCSTRADLVDEPLLAELARAGCQAIQFGVESGAQNILDSVKGIRKDQVLRAVQAAVQNGIEVAASFMIPFPEDTEETIRETKDFMRLLRGLGARILLSFTTPYPGTLFAHQAAELGLEILTDRWEEFDAKHNLLRTKYLTEDGIERLVQEVARDVGLVQSSGSTLESAG